ncbi:hypothetical protein [Croceicoccus mobilis]|uniref:DUF429 domain-containing protein n=1 Tax=Croceicoccus mobilis TaxID=1703339 RepID=A0A916Z0V9_9SPHN|nr:hypothetical protein [Croceicoccus mobilis]GGD69147.1 hypothetical protein GCM10010990_18360 [Croceicoccus mobilis]
MPRFRHFLAVDWSGAATERPGGIAMALAHAGGGAPVLVDAGRGWSREDVLALLREDLPDDTLVGLDLGISLPFADCGAFFPGWADSPPDAQSLWALIDDICAGDPHLSATSFVDHPELSAYFRRHNGREGALFHAPGAAHRRGRFRVTEERQQLLGCKPYSNFNLVGAAQVGKSSLTGMRVLHRLDGRIPVWPIDRLPATGSAIVEIYTTIPAVAAGRRAGTSKIRSHEELAQALSALGSAAPTGSGSIDDHSADALLSAAWMRIAAGDETLWKPEKIEHVAQTEGWTFGAP